MRNYFLVLVVSLSVLSCTKRMHEITQIEPQNNTSINASLPSDAEMEAFIQPFKVKMDGEMNKVLTYTKVDLTKDGFNSPLANLNCDMIMEEANFIYENRHNQKIDMCLLNWGGMRRTFAQGELTLKNAFELMPFDNMAWVVTMSGNQIEEMVRYLSSSEVGHPIAGMQFVSNDITSLKINGNQFDPNKTYTVVTNDFLLNGGDDMKFFANSLQKEDLDRKLRDMIISYFTRHDTINVNLDKRILK